MKKLKEMKIGDKWHKVYVNLIVGEPNRSRVWFVDKKLNEIYWDCGSGRFATDEMIIRDVRK
ncbi:MAG: hypothetical protein LBF00_02230 [Mycoplasmataceae bacterium]|jgi:hypothetical protein|nr:hypothetical protein [Mycoplasmataceae bacterium]